MIGMFAEVLNALGRKRAVVLNGAGFMDEASLQGENHLVVLEEGSIRKMTIHPEDVGLSVYKNEAIRGGDAKENAEILTNILKGEKGAKRDTVLLNAGIGILPPEKRNPLRKEFSWQKKALIQVRRMRSSSSLLKKQGNSNRGDLSGNDFR